MTKQQIIPVQEAFTT